MFDLGNNLQFSNKFTNNFNYYNMTGSVTITNPLLNPIANNGRFSPTISLQMENPAINAGNGYRRKISVAQIVLAFVMLVHLNLAAHRVLQKSSAMMLIFVFPQIRQLGNLI